MTTYVGNNVFPTAITEVVGGTAGTSASVNVGLEGLADRTVWLKTRADAADGSQFRNLRTPKISDITAVAFDFNSHKRGDGTNTAFWSNSWHYWIKCGVDTAGKYYIGDNDVWILADTGALSPPKVSFGCDSANTPSATGRVCLFNGDLKTTGGGVDPQYILGPTVGNDYSGTWTTKSLDTIGSFVTYVRAYDCVVTPTQRIIVAGGGDLSGAGQFLVWKSDDNGNTFTRVTVGNVSSSQDALTRVIVGKNGRLVAWIKTTPVNQGDKLFYSDDNGNTWSSRSSIGFAQISDGVYLPDLDLWAFASLNTTSIWTTPDPVVGSFTQFSTIAVPAALGGFKHYLFWAVSFSSTWKEIRWSPDAMASQLVLARSSYSTDFVHLAASTDRGQMLFTGQSAGVSSITQTERL